MATPTHTTGHGHTNTQTDKKLEGKVGTVTISAFLTFSALSLVVAFFYKVKAHF